MKQDKTQRAGQAQAPLGWKRPQLTYIGNVGDVLQGGGGKLSPTCADKGDIGKPRGQH